MRSSKTKKSRNYLAMWDMTGLECLIDLTEIEQKRMWETLQGQKELTPWPPLQMMIMRAQANTQRHYEIYTFAAEEGINIDMLSEMFRHDPQYIVDSIRETGNIIYSHRLNEKSRVIT